MSGFVDNEIKDAAQHYGKRLSVEEFLIDFFGGLVPGVLFLVTVAFALVPPFHALWAVLWGGERKPLSEFWTSFFQSTQNSPSAIWLILFVGGLLFAFVMGHLFYRYDPKNADMDSFGYLDKKLEKKLKRGEMKGDIVTLRKGNLGCTTKDNCEFPYPDYADYLEQRGFKHLLPFITWKKESWRESPPGLERSGENNDQYRSKIYINLLKVRLRYHHPDKIGTIIRIESHIRLASSTWYVARILWYVSLFGLLISTGAFIGTLAKVDLKTGEAMAWHIPAVFAPAIVLGFSLFTKRTIRGFFHYQRLREVFFVLETAFTAFKGSYELLDPPFASTEFEEQ